MVRYSWKAHRKTEAARRCFLATGAKVEVVKRMFGGNMSFFVRAEHDGMLWEIYEPIVDLVICVRSPKSVRFHPGRGEKPLLGIISTREVVFSGGDSPVDALKAWLMRHRHGWRTVGSPSDTSGMGFWRYARGGYGRVALELPPEIMEAIAGVRSVAERDGADLRIDVWPDRIYYIFTGRERGKGIPSAESDEGMMELIRGVGRMARWRWTQEGWLLQ